MNYLIKSIFLFLTLLISNEGLAQKGIIGLGFTYHPIAKNKGINVRFGVGNGKTSVVFEYNHFLAGESKKLYQVGANLNLKWNLSEMVKGKLIGGAYLMRYKSVKFTSSSLSFSVGESSDNFLGGNIGIGIEVSLSKYLMFFAEGKYTFHKEVEKNFLFEKASGRYFIPTIGLAFTF